MKINMQKWAQDIIDSKDVRNLPVLYFPCLKNIGMGVPESVQSSQKIAEAMAEVIKEYPETIAAITGMDLTVDSEAFGAAVHFSDTQAPNIESHVIEDAEDIKNLKIPDMSAGRIQVFSDACAEAAKLITDRPIFGGMLGPFSLAANLMEMSSALMLAMEDEDSMKLLLEKATDFLIARAKDYKEKGANGVFIAEPTAGLLSPDMLDNLSSVYVKKIVDAVQDDYFFLILHDCGQVVHSVDSMYKTGCKGHHYGNSVDMKDILPQIPPDILVFGNIDPSCDFYTGTPESIFEKTTALLESMKEYPHFVLSSGCDLAPAVTNENVAAYYEACRQFNQKSGLKTVINIDPFLA